MPQHATNKPRRIERLTNLALALCEADHPLTLDEIVTSVPGYPLGSNSETTRAAFERDKRALRESGIEIDVDTSMRAVAAYRFLGRQDGAAELDSSDEDVALWTLALRVSEARCSAHRDAIAKLAALSAPGACLMTPSAATVTLLQLALIERRNVLVTHRRHLLDLEPFGLTSDGRSMVLIARDRHSLDDRPNAYRLDAFSSLPALGVPDCFQLPASFDPQHRLDGATLHERTACAQANAFTLSVGERFRRLMAILSYLGAVGSARLDRIADLFQMSQSAVVEELERASCCGVAPFSPDRLLELVIDEGVVSGFGLERFRSAHGLTTEEIGVVIEAIGVLAAAPGLVAPDALRRALTSLHAALGPSAIAAASAEYHRHQTQHRAAWPPEWSTLLHLKADEVSPLLGDVLVGTPRRRARGLAVMAFLADRRWQRDLLGHLDIAPATERRAA